MNRREFLQLGTWFLIAAALGVKTGAETQRRGDTEMLTVPVSWPGELPGCLPLGLAMARPQRVYVPLVIKGNG